MLNANALRASMVENNCSVRELAEICGLKPKAFYQRLNGRVDFRVGEIIKCSADMVFCLRRQKGSAKQSICIETRQDDNTISKA